MSHTLPLYFSALSKTRWPPFNNRSQEPFKTKLTFSRRKLSCESFKLTHKLILFTWISTIWQSFPSIFTCELFRESAVMTDMFCSIRTGSYSENYEEKVVMDDVFTDELAVFLSYVCPEGFEFDRTINRQFFVFIKQTNLREDSSKFKDYFLQSTTSIHLSSSRTVSCARGSSKMWKSTSRAVSNFLGCDVTSHLRECKQMWQYMVFRRVQRGAIRHRDARPTLLRSSHTILPVSDQDPDSNGLFSLFAVMRTSIRFSRKSLGSTTQLWSTRQLKPSRMLLFGFTLARESFISVQ